MTQKELKGLSRNDLLELLIAQTEKCEAMEKELTQAKATIESREILISNCGSLAEAAMQVNQMDQAADKAAGQYLSNVMRMCRDVEKKCANLEAECAERSEELMGDTKKKCAAMEQETQARCAEMLKDAETKSQAYWTEVHTKLEQYCATHQSLAALLQQKG